MGKLDEALKKANINNLETISRLKDIDSESSYKPSPHTRQPTDSDPATKFNLKAYPKNKYEERVERSVDFRLVVYRNPQSLPAEHFKVLRSAIMYPRDGKKIKSVLVTSALENEGKTMVACNLAVSIAQSVDPYVLLIDGDVRRPSVQKMLGLERAAGLTDYLLSGKSLSHFLMKGILDKMTVLQAGSLVKNPAELITSEKMHQLLEEATNRYADRLIIIDSPPVNLAAETLVLAKQVDVVILVVRYGVSDKTAVEDALNKLSKEKILGVVFNGFEVTPRKYTYYKSKYYY